jgi:CheY-like chemotaxis protein/anti-sigma regulatory factor (Ser/Thr protein kinase)
MSVERSRLLVVDDEEFNREIIAEYLEDEPWDLTMAQDGRSALALLHAPEAAFDAVVLDRMMPEIDGLEVLRHIRQDPSLQGLPVILQTAAAGREQVAEGLRLGAYYYLTKPYHRDALVAVVRSALNARSQRLELAQRIEEYRGVMALVLEGTFQFRTLGEARALAAALGSACADPDAASLGLVELLVNAVEHGNLGISLEEKAALLSNGRWEREVQARLARPEYAEKTVRVSCRRVGADLIVLIADQGEGFDWAQFLTMDESRAFQPNGRGISLARRLAFRTLEYRGCGNEVVATLAACVPEADRGNGPADPKQREAA